MGIFQAAQQWKTVVMLLPNLINSSALPILANEANNRKRFVQTAKYNIFSCAGLSFITALGIILFSRLVMLLYGKDFRLGFLPLVLTVLMAVLQSVSQTLTQVMISTNRVWSNLAVNAGWARGHDSFGPVGRLPHGSSGGGLVPSEPGVMGGHVVPLAGLYRLQDRTPEGRAIVR